MNFYEYTVDPEQPAIFDVNSPFKMVDCMKCKNCGGTNIKEIRFRKMITLFCETCKSNTII